MDQYLVDYTVRNITTGDEEEIRVLEITDAEFEGFPDEIRDEIRSLVAVGVEAVFGHGRPHSDWDTAQEQIVGLLMPYVSNRALFDSDYGQWEENLLEGDDSPDTATVHGTELTDAEVADMEQSA
jgi:hypothetical protein